MADAAADDKEVSRIAGFVDQARRLGERIRLPERHPSLSRANLKRQRPGTFDHTCIGGIEGPQRRPLSLRLIERGEITKEKVFRTHLGMRNSQASEVPPRWRPCRARPTVCEGWFKD